MVELQNIDNAISGASQTMQAFLQIQDMNRVMKYAIMLDELNMEKMKLLGQDSIIEQVEEEQKRQEQEAMMMQQYEQEMAQQEAMMQQGAMR
jgi:hypothetical protein